MAGRPVDGAKSDKPTRPRGAAAKQPPSAQTGRRWVMPLAIVGAVAVILVVTLVRAQDSDKTSAPGAGGADPGLGHVHGLGVDPGDGTLYAATHYGVFRIPATGPATRIAGNYQDTMGFTVVGPRHFLGSGHPAANENRPSRLGLIESTDAGQTWQTLSLEGEVDFHALRSAHGRVYGFDAASARFLVSQDRRTWETRGVAPMFDFAVSPDNPDTILAATLEYGVALSTDGGRSFATTPSAPPITQLAWPAKQVLYGGTATGAIMVSTDGGTSWEQRGSLDARPEAMVAVGTHTVHVATASGIYTSTDGGRTFALRYHG